MPGTPLDMSRQEHEATLAAAGAGQSSMHQKGSAASTESAHLLQVEELQVSDSQTLVLYGNKRKENAMLQDTLSKPSPWNTAPAS